MAALLLARVRCRRLHEYVACPAEGPHKDYCPRLCQKRSLVEGKVEFLGYLTLCTVNAGEGKIGYRVGVLLAECCDEIGYLAARSFVGER